MTDTAKEEKKRLRKQIKTILSQLSEESIKQQSASVTKKATQLPEYVNAQSISVFLAMPDREISTTDIVHDAFSKGKHVFIPYIYSVEGSRTKNMHMLRLRDEDDLKSLKPDAWGIPSLSPKDIGSRENAFGGKGISTETVGSSSNLDLIFMPGMAFDRSNNRLGHGKGFYDKYISQIHSIVSSSPSHSMPKLVGLALREQLLSENEEVPTDEFDWKINQLVVADI